MSVDKMKYRYESSFNWHSMAFELGSVRPFVIIKINKEFVFST